MPVAVCRTSELTEAGAFFTEDVDDTPVLITRDARGSIRALVNLCRHRGARLVHEKQGVAKSFTCILHGWIYDAAGQMGGAPLARLAEQNPMLATIRETNALIPLPSELRHGFVWVEPRPRAAIDVASFLGPFDDELAALEHHAVRERTETPLPPSARLQDAVPQAERVFVLSDTQILVFHAAEVSLVTRCRRRAETDFGESTSSGEETVTLARIVLTP